MSYKVAVASSDGKVVNQHFGKATQFLIFNIEDQKYIFDEIIKTAPFCKNGYHNESKILSATERLIGCRAVLVTQIGDGALKVLENKGIDVFEVKTLIQDALNKVILYYSEFNGGN